MSGFQEILLLAAIVAGIVILPKITRRADMHIPPLRLVRQNRPRLTAKLRLAIAVSVFWPMAVAAYFHPWSGDLITFLYLGLGPVAVGWSIFWIMSGYRKS